MKKFNKDVSIIFPVYNEEKNIGLCIIIAHSILSELVRNFEVIIINDGSTDKTKKICIDLIKKFDNIKLLSKEKNEGYGYAIRDGFKNSNFDLVFFTDSDSQFDIRNLAELLEYINEYDLVVGFRKSRQDSLKRKILSWGFNLIVRIIFKINVRDIDCAFKLFRKSIFNKIEIESQRYFVNTEILAKAKALNFSIKEVPVSHFPRFLGESKVGFLDIPRTIKELVRIYRSLQKFNKNEKKRTRTLE